MCVFSGKPSPFIRVTSCTNEDKDSPVIRRGDRIELRCFNKGFLAIKNCKWYFKNDSSTEPEQLRHTVKNEEEEVKATCFCLCCKKKYDTLKKNSEGYEHENSTENGFKLTILKVDEKHAGDYTCKAKNIFRENTSSTWTLKLNGNAFTFFKNRIS